MVITLYVTLTGTLNPISGARCSSFALFRQEFFGGCPSFSTDALIAQVGAQIGKGASCPFRNVGPAQQQLFATQREQYCLAILVCIVSPLPTSSVVLSLIPKH